MSGPPSMDPRAQRLCRAQWEDLKLMMVGGNDEHMIKQKQKDRDYGDDDHDDDHDRDDVDDEI